MTTTWPGAPDLTEMAPYCVSTVTPAFGATVKRYSLRVSAMAPDVRQAATIRPVITARCMFSIRPRPVETTQAIEYDPVPFDTAWLFVRKRPSGAGAHLRLLDVAPRKPWHHECKN